jgi:N6-adenosine-specific RNA methylase IME4
MPDKYRTIVADPPWSYPEGFASGNNNPHKKDRERGVPYTGTKKVMLPYPSMELSEIAALPVGTLSDDDCRLFLWATNRYLPDAFNIVDSWGFTYKQVLIWDKTPNIPPFGGSVAPNAAEYLLVATKGTPRRLSRWNTSVVRARKARATHSKKPEIFQDIVEQVSPGPYLELFARRQRLGWDVWGNEVDSDVELAA